MENISHNRSTTELANYLNISRMSVLNYIKLLGLEIPRDITGAYIINPEQQRKIIDYVRSQEIRVEGAVNCDDIADDFCISTVTLLQYAHEIGIYQHSKWGTKSWYTPEEAKQVTTYIQKKRDDKEIEKRKRDEQRQQELKLKHKAPKVKKEAPKKKKDYWKLSISNDGIFYFVKACSLSTEDAINIRDSLLVLGLDAKISHNIEPKFSGYDMFERLF